MRLIRAALPAVLAVTLFGCSTATPHTTDRTGHSESLLTLTDVAAYRIELADTVAAAKWGTNAGINDPEREKAVLDTVADESKQLDIDPAASVDPLHEDALARALTSICP